MRIALRLGLALVALLVVGLAVLAVLLPRIVKSDAVRARIETAAEQALGREVRYAELDFGLVPPSLLVRGPSVAGAAKGDPPLVRAEEVALRVALAPLLARTVVVDSLVVEGATLRLVRTAQGLELPTPASSDDAPAEPSDREEGTPVALALRRLALRDATLVLEDRVVSPAVTWELRGVDADARGESLDDPIAFEANGSLASGGEVAVEGTATLGGAFDAEVRLDGFALAPVGPYVPDASELAGALSGSIRVVGPAADLEQIAADLSLREVRVALQDVALRGTLGLKAELAGGLERPSGRFDVDATDAELRYGDAFQKPPGRAATLSGRLVTRKDGSLGVEDAVAQVHNLKADAAVGLGKRTRVTANVAPFDLAGWEELVPALAEYGLSGTLRLGEVRLATAPLELNASIPVDGLRAHHPHAGPVRLRGTVVAKGQAIETRELALVAAEQTIAIDASVRDLGATPRYRVRTQTVKADTNALVSAFTTRRDTFYGLLDLDGDLSGRTGEAPLRSLRGTTNLDIREGRIVGLSLLRVVLAGLGDAGRSAQGLATLAVNYAALAAPELQRFYREDFESLTGTFRFADGTASTDDLELVYRDYAARLDGRLGLEEADYDLGCTLTLGPAVADLLARKLGGEAASLERLTIPARLTGRLDAPFELGRNPRVVVPARAAVAFFQSIYLARQRSDAERAIDDALGEGAGEQVLDVLDGILGGGQRRR